MEPSGPVLHHDLLEEIRRLQLQVQALHGHLALDRARSRVRHGWLRVVVKDLETNPHTQYKVHLAGAVYWLANFPLITALFFFAPALWLKLGIFITLIYSVYANFSTDYSGMSAAMAAFDDGAVLPEIPLETR